MRSSAEKIVPPFTSVRLEPVRSAEPPTSSGSAGAIALITVPLAARLATFPLVASNFGSVFSHPVGRSPCQRRPSSLAATGWALVKAMKRSIHAFCSATPRAFASRQWVSASSGTWNGSVLGHPYACLVRRISSFPRGSPCAFAVSARLGEP